MTGDRVAAEDLVQDYRGTFRDDGSFETWLFRIARNARVDYFRQRPPVDALGDDALDRPEPQAGPARRLEAARERARLRRALMQLREDKRELLVLARYRDMKYEQIADILGIEVGAVKVRVHRALRELREIFLQLKDENPSWTATSPKRTFQII
jgi:RNA polymerase sigma-70 factor (ECF subfamily)